MKKNKVWVLLQSGYVAEPRVEVYKNKAEAQVEYTLACDQADKDWDDLTHKTGYVGEATAREHKVRGGGLEKAYIDRAGDLMTYVRLQSTDIL